VNALDYLVKPISFERFLKSAMKAREYYEVREKNIPEPGLTAPGYFFIKADNKLVKLFFDELLFAEALQNYVVIHTKEKKYITYLTFKAVEEYLPGDRFVKTHKSYIVAASRIDSIEGNGIRIGPHHIPISRNLREEVMEKLLNNRFLRR
jgi:DNA-binding LytR/AlgR family response regulator